MKTFLSKLLTLACLSLCMASGIALLDNDRAVAVTGADFNPGRIIDDAIFFNKHAASPDDIQAFLNRTPCDRWGSKPSEYGGGTRAQYGASRGNPAPYTCLSDYFENPTTHQNNLEGRTPPPGAKSAAQLIWEAAQTYTINPWVLVVLLQKEQALVKDEWPWPLQFRSAMGFGCPDTATCDVDYYGFYNQVVNAAYQFRAYADKPWQFNYVAGINNTIRWSPNPACGSSTVFIENTATAALYNYTPYRPNQAALNNLYGTGDSCSAYGNRNFWRLFNDWFGSTLSNTTTVPHPDGTLIVVGDGVFIIESQTRRWIANPAVFDSYNFAWNKIKQPTIGDTNLPMSAPIADIRPGTLLTAPGHPIYVVIRGADGVVRRQHLSYASFQALGYNAGHVLSVTESQLPKETAPGFYGSNAHPDGSAVHFEGNPTVFVIDGGKRRPIAAAEVYNSHFNGRWNFILPATAADAQLPVGELFLYREGYLVHKDGSIFAVDFDLGPGQALRHVHPWVCFSDRFRFTIGEVSFQATSLPARFGAPISC